ncbi:diguanylate cyclase [Paenibacillus sp. YYML68]|uniref:diguanylate cyclase n=1 Tax=Paenibacillus sp. YYML68 TaxID=2909250 RepID=UPI002491B998|nr:diguanylate cyclase [Paenibacillus sp. YYML68]
MNFKRLQTKIAVMLIVTLALIVGANNWITSFLFQQEYSRVLQQELAVVGNSLLTQLDRLSALGVPLEELTGFEQQCKEIISKYPDVSHAFVIDPNGRILFHSNPVLIGTEAELPYYSQALMMVQETRFDYSMEDELYTAVVLPVQNNSLEPASGAVVVTMRKSVITQKLAAYALVPIVLSFIFVALAFYFIMITLSRWVTKPLRVMSMHMGLVAAGDLRTNADIVTKDEIGQLASSFNHMVTQINDLLRRTAQTAELETQYELERRQREVAEKLQRIVSSVSSSLDVQQVMDRVLQGSRELLPYRHAAVWMLDHGQLLQKSAVSELDSEPNFHQEEVESAFRHMCETGEPHMSPDAKVLWYPLTIEQNRVGLIGLTADEPFTSQQMTAAYSLFSQVSVFIHNASLYKRMQQLATTDSLTGLLNRGTFIELAESALVRSQQESTALSFIMFDIDHFKSVNDRYGHLVGDKVLKGVARKVSELLEHDASARVGRYGGEEFIVMLEYTGLEESSRLAEVIRQAVSELTFTSDSGTLSVTISLGVSTARTDNTMKLKQLLKEADQALYAAKYSGRNKVCMA